MGGPDGRQLRRLAHGTWRLAPWPAMGPDTLPSPRARATGPMRPWQTSSSGLSSAMLAWTSLRSCNVPQSLRERNRLLGAIHAVPWTKVDLPCMDSVSQHPVLSWNSVNRSADMDRNALQKCSPLTAPGQPRRRGGSAVERQLSGVTVWVVPSRHARGESPASCRSQERHHGRPEEPT